VPYGQSEFIAVGCLGNRAKPVVVGLGSFKFMLFGTNASFSLLAIVTLLVMPSMCCYAACERLFFTPFSSTSKLDVVLISLGYPYYEQ
jgi:hypothetical protein